MIQPRDEKKITVKIWRTKTNANRVLVLVFCEIKLKKLVLTQKLNDILFKHFYLRNFYKKFDSKTRRNYQNLNFFNFTPGAIITVPSSTRANRENHKYKIIVKLNRVMQELYNNFGRFGGFYS